MKLNLNDKYKLHLTHMTNNKVLHKVRKQWVVISFSTLALLLGTSALPLNTHANTNIQNEIAVRPVSKLNRINNSNKVKHTQQIKINNSQPVTKIAYNQKDNSIITQAKHLHKNLLHHANQNIIRLGGRYGKKYYRRYARRIRRIRRRKARKAYRRYIRKRYIRKYRAYKHRIRRRYIRKHKHHARHYHHKRHYVPVASSSDSTGISKYSNSDDDWNRDSDTPTNPDSNPNLSDTLSSNVSNSDNTSNNTASLSSELDSLISSELSQSASASEANISNSDNHPYIHNIHTSQPSNESDGNSSYYDNSINSDTAYSDGYNDANNLLTLPSDTSSNNDEQKEIERRGMLIFNSYYERGFIDGAKNETVSKANAINILKAYIKYLDNIDSTNFTNGWSNGLYNNYDYNIVTSPGATTDDYYNGWYQGNIVDCGGNKSAAYQDFKQFLNNQLDDEN